MISLYSIFDLFQIASKMPNNESKVRKQILEIVHAELGEFLCPKPTIEDMGKIYSSEGWIPAIKAWRQATGLGLKDAKDAINEAVDKFGWPDSRLNRIAIISSMNDEIHGKTCSIERIERTSEECVVRILGEFDGDPVKTISVNSLRFCTY